MTKTIKQLSKELKVTPQAIYKKINNQLNNELLNHITKGKRGETLVDKEGEDIIKSTFHKPVEQHNVNSLNNSLLDILKTELEQKNILIESLTRQNENLIRQNENAQKLLANQQQQNQLLIEGSSQKLGFFDKWFKRSNNIISND